MLTLHWVLANRGRLDTALASAAALAGIVAGVAVLLRSQLTDVVSADSVVALLGVAAILTGGLRLFGGFHDDPVVDESPRLPPRVTLGILEIAVGGVLILMHGVTRPTAIATGLWGLVAGAVLLRAALVLRAHSTVHDGRRRRGQAVLRGLDDLQRRHRAIGFPYAVLRKYLDDEGAKLAALMTYYGFLSVFPLLLFAVAVLTEILAAHPSLQERLIDELVAPRLRPDVELGLQQLPPAGIPLLIGAVGLLLCATGGVLAGYTALNRIWAVPRRARFGLGRRYGRALLMLLVSLLGAVIVAGQRVLISAVPRLPAAQRIASTVGAFAVVLVVLVLAHKVLTARPLRARQLLLGSVLGAAAVMALLDLGATRLPALIARSGPVYGSFATVVGIFTLLYLVSQALVLSAEICAVQAHRLSPRSLLRTAHTDVDVRALTLLAQEQERLPDQRIGVTFGAWDEPGPREPVKRQA